MRKFNLRQNFFRFWILQFFLTNYLLEYFSSNCFFAKAEFFSLGTNPFSVPFQFSKSLFSCLFFDFFLLISSVIRQKSEFQDGCFKKTKHVKFSEKPTFLSPDTHAYGSVTSGKKFLIPKQSSSS